ncbi:MAG TPA: NB-ARC domain-containing protein [Chloroflexia bacterium]|nr:NB-ARC domain-containing protein [Chloroflexia bacterium]
MRNERFGRLLKGAIGSIVMHEGKTAPVVEEDLGNQLGLTAASIQRYKAGHIPPDPPKIEALAVAGVRRGYLNREWLLNFLSASNYPYPEELLKKLYPDSAGASSVSAKKSYSNLPAPGFARFIARQAAYARLMEGLKSRLPVVLVVGLGGMGKTSLAYQAASDCLHYREGRPHFAGVVWISDREQPGTLTLPKLLDEIALTLDYPGFIALELEARKREVAGLLRRQPVLLVVDNYETTSEVALANWLIQIPEPSKVIITSREFRKEFEQRCWPVELNGMSRSEALQFIEYKAALLQLEGILNHEEWLKALLEISGSNPKALEVLLGYLKYSDKTFEELLAELETAEGELFEDLFSRSWALLGSAERQALMALPLFTGSAGRESLLTTAGLAAAAGREALEKLVKLSLVDRQKASIAVEPGYNLHPLVRAFALARLREQPDFEREAKERQLNRYLKLVEKVGYCWDEPERLNLLDPEHETLSELMRRCYEQHSYRVLLELISGADYYYYIRGAWTGDPGVSYMRVVAASKVAGLAEQVRAISYHVQLLCRKGDLEEARGWLDRLENPGDAQDFSPELLFEIKYAWGLYHMAGHDYERASRLWQETLPMAGQISERNLAVTRGQLAICLYQMGKAEAAEQLWQTVLEEAATGKFTRGVTSSQIGLARICLDRRELERGEQYLEVAQKSLPDRVRQAEVLALYARLYDLRGDTEKALAFKEEALDLYERLTLNRRLPHDQVDDR